MEAQMPLPEEAKEQRSIPTVSRSSRWSRAVPYLLLLGIILGSFGNILRHELVYDDVYFHQMISEHEAGFDPKWLLLSKLFERDDIGVFRPLQKLSADVEYRATRAFGLPDDDAIVYQVINLLAHFAAATMVFVFLVEMGLTRSTALAGSLLFAAHPLATDVVNSFTDRSESVSCALGLLALLCFRRSRYVPAALLLFLCICERESGLTFACFLLVLEFLMPSRPRRQGLARAVGVVCVVVIPWFLYRRAVLPGAVAGVTFLFQPLTAMSFPERLWAAFGIQTEYWKMFLWPLEHAYAYTYDSLPLHKTLAEPAVLLAVAVFVSSLAMAVAARRRRPALALFLVGYWVLFATTSNLVLPLAPLAAERYFYTPSVCVIGIACLGVDALRRTGARTCALGLLLACALVSAGLSHQQNESWTHFERFLESTLRRFPNSANAHFNMGVHYAAVLGREDPLAPERLEMKSRALAEFEKAVAIMRPFGGYLEAERRAASLLIESGRRAESIPYLRAIAAEAPGFVTTFALGSNLMQVAGHEDEGLRVLHQAFTTTRFDLRLAPKMEEYARLLRGHGPAGATAALALESYNANHHLSFAIKLFAAGLREGEFETRFPHLANAREHARRKDWPDARAELRLALANEPLPVELGKAFKDGELGATAARPPTARAASDQGGQSDGGGF